VLEDEIIYRVLLAGKELRGLKQVRKRVGNLGCV
jgi:hypothetical protein